MGGGNPFQSFSVKILSTHTSAMSRQVKEAHLIKSYKGGELLNSKFEYNHGILPTITTTDPKSMLPPEAPPRNLKMSQLDKLNEMEALVYAKVKRKALEDEKATHPNKRARKNPKETYEKKYQKSCKVKRKI